MSGHLVHLTSDQILPLPDEFQQAGWVDISCGKEISAPLRTDGHWRTWGNATSADAAAKIDSLGPKVPSISMSNSAIVWIETE